MNPDITLGKVDSCHKPIKGGQTGITMIPTRQEGTRQWLFDSPMK